MPPRQGREQRGARGFRIGGRKRQRARGQGRAAVKKARGVTRRRRRRRIDAGGDGRCGDDKGAGGPRLGCVPGSGGWGRAALHGAFPLQLPTLLLVTGAAAGFFPLYGHRCHFLWSLFTVICACRPLCARGTRKGEEFSLVYSYIILCILVRCCWWWSTAYPTPRDPPRPLCKE